MTMLGVKHKEQQNEILLLVESSVLTSQELW